MKLADKEARHVTLEDIRDFQCDPSPHYMDEQKIRDHLIGKIQDGHTVLVPTCITFGNFCLEATSSGEVLEVLGYTMSGFIVRYAKYPVPAY